MMARLFFFFSILSLNGMAQSSVTFIEADTLAQQLAQDGSLVLLDTRSPQEYQEGHLENARFVNYATFQLSDVQDIPKDARIVVYCLSGGRSGRVAEQLVKAGYQDVKNLKGGIRSWQAAGQTVVRE